MRWRTRRQRGFMLTHCANVGRLAAHVGPRHNTHARSVALVQRYIVRDELYGILHLPWARHVKPHTRLSRRGTHNVPQHKDGEPASPT